MGNITKDKFIPLAPRIRQGTETSTVSYEDIGVSKGLTYNYALDSFDRYGNRSALSEVKTIIAGDVTAPGPVTATASISGYKAIEFKWQNPSDLDFMGCYLYSDLAKTNKIHELGGITPSSFTTKAFTTNTDTESKNIYVTTFDKNRNESITPVRIYGVSLAPPGGTNVTDTISLSIIGNNGTEWQKNANLSIANEISPITIHVQCSTALNVTGVGDGLTIYEVDGGVFYTTQSLTLIQTALNYRLYKTAPINLNINPVHITEGKGFIKVKGKDSLGAELLDSMSIFVDRTLPVISSMVIDNGGTVTNDRAVDVLMTYSDGTLGVNATGVTAYQLSTTNSQTNNWIGLTSTSNATVNVTYTLPNVEKTYNLYGWVKDNAANVSAVKTPDAGQTIRYSKAQGVDNMAISIITNRNLEYQKNAYLSNQAEVSPITIHVQCSTALDVTGSNYGVFLYDALGNKFAQGDTLSTISNYTNYKLYSTAGVVLTPAAQGKGFVRVRAKDSLGRELQDSMTIFIDNTDPIISSLVIDNNRSTTNSRTVFAKLIFTDGTFGVNASGVESYQLSTVTSIANNWLSVDTAAGTIITTYTLPDREKSYTIKGWVKDKAKNISGMATGNTIEYIKLKSTPSGSITFLIVGSDLTLVAITPNSNGWFNQNIKVRYISTVPQGAPASVLIKKIYYRTNTNGAGWTPTWNEVIVSPAPTQTINIDITTEGTTDIEFYSMTNQNESGGNMSATIKIDKTAPSMTKANFWNNTKTENINRESVLFWNNTSGSDTASGLKQTYIYRSTNISWTNAHTVESVDINKQWTIDDDDELQTGRTYTYWGRFNDAADNLSGTSNPKPLTATYDWEYEYRNWISNGSFERTTYDGNMLKTIDWKFYTYPGVESAQGNTPYALATSQESYYGKKSLLIPPFGGGGYTMHIPNDNRMFTLSFWEKSPLCLFETNLQLQYCKPDGTTDKTVDLYYATSPSWTQHYYNFSQSLTANSAIPTTSGYVKIKFIDQQTFDSRFIDGVQWEEGRHPTKFIDNQAINTQRLNAGIIDANHIVARSITAGLIKADTITANEIAANAITTNELAANSVTATKILAGAITATSLAANSVTAVKILAGEIDSTKIVAGGLQIKSGGMSMITVGDSATPTTNKEFTVMATNDLYFKPYGYDDRWTFNKHIESNFGYFGINLEFKRRYLDSDGMPYSPEAIMIPKELMYSSPSVGTIRRWYSVYSTAGGITGHCATLLRGGPTWARANWPDVTHDVTLGSEDIFTLPLMSSAAPMEFDVSIPWAGPSGTLQKVKYEILTAPISGVYTSMGYFEKNYRGSIQTFPHSRYVYSAIDIKNIGAKYVKLKYLTNTNGPSTIRLHYCEYITLPTNPKTWYVDDEYGWNLDFSNTRCQLVSFDGFFQK